MPSKPWPKKIAGVPCYLTADRNDPGPIIPIRCRSRSSIRLSNDLDLRDSEAAVDLIFDLVRDFFAQTDISITEILFWGHLIAIVLDDEGSKTEGVSAVPRSVAQCNCFYLFESEMARPRKLTARQIKPVSLAKIDDSQYDTIRPGVMLSSGRHPMGEWEVLTSSGVLVKDHGGSQYMTVAAYGFPFGGKVHRPNASGRTLGNPVVELTHADIALVKLDQGVDFVNEPFENTVMQAPAFKLEGFVRAAETKIGADVFLDSPFSGFVEGTRGPHSLLQVPFDDPREPEQLWIRCQWDYMGQDTNKFMVDSMCGSAIWDQNHKVLGFFRYAPKSGVLMDWCMSVAADHLLDKGYTMA